MAGNIGGNHPPGCLPASSESKIINAPCLYGNIKTNWRDRKGPLQKLYKPGPAFERMFRIEFTIFLTNPLSRDPGYVSRLLSTGTDHIMQTVYNPFCGLFKPTSDEFLLQKGFNRAYLSILVFVS